MAEPATTELAASDERATLAFGARLAGALSHPTAPPARDLAVPFLVVYLTGELGAGKTTFVRGVLRAFGVQGAIRSPTFTLLETYELDGRLIAHLDLYRLTGADLDTLGVRDLLTGGTVLFVEWPERAGGALPPPDLRVQFDFAPVGRLLRCTATSPAGQALVQDWLR